MKNNTGNQPHRRPTRLTDFDYATSAAYFVTVCTQDHKCLFGEIENGEMVLNAQGEIVRDVWNELPRHYPNVELDAFIVMPNHVHAIIVLVDGRTVGEGLKPSPTAGPAQTGVMNDSIPDGIAVEGCKPSPTKTHRHGVTEIVRAFKTFSARQINENRQTLGVPVWQRSFYEHVIRKVDDMATIREYISNNPLRWELDRENQEKNPEGL